MSFLYITADRIGIPTGGGSVTHHESEALKTLGPCEVWGRERLSAYPGMKRGGEPWVWDELARISYLDHWINEQAPAPKLAHFYAGTFTQTVASLKDKGCVTVYTAAAHDVALSRVAHEELGVPYHYPHLTDPAQLQRYLGGYLNADILVCPSQHSANVMRAFGAKQRIEVIPHGCHLPAVVAPLPRRFVVGYLGSYGPDKGVRYLLEAWKKLNYPDAMLILAGAESCSEWVGHLIERFGGGNIYCMGWVEDVADFYNNISLYVQPSVSEGFGCEVLEAMAHSRTALCSRGAGAVDLLPEMTGLRFNAMDVDDLAQQIDFCKKHDYHVLHGPYSGACRNNAAKYSWDKIRARYVDLWKGLLGN